MQNCCSCSFFFYYYLFILFIKRKKKKKKKNNQKYKKRNSWEFLDLPSFKKRESLEMQNRMTKIQEKTQVGTLLSGQELINNNKMGVCSR